MNGKERFSRALRMAEPPDRVPVAPPFQGYWALDAFGVSVPESLSDPKKAIQAISRAQEAAPFDAIEVVWDWFAFIDVLGCTSEITPAGSPMVVKNPITSLDDLAKLKPVDTSADARVQASLVAAEALLAEFGDEFLCYATIPLPFTTAGHMRDAAHLMVDMIKRPAGAHQLLDYATQVILEHLKLYAALGVQGFIVCDPSASGDLLSPRHFVEFVAPYTKTVVQAVHDAGLPSILHICGNTTGSLATIAEIAPTALSFDYAVDVSVAKEAIGDSVCLLGNVDPAGTLLSTPDVVRDEAARCVEKGRPGGGYVLGAGCDLSVGTPLENVKTMIDVGHEAEY